MAVLGNIIGQCTSGERSLICCGLPPQTRPNTRVSPSAVTALVTSTTAAHSPCPDCANCCHRSVSTQKEPKGGRATMPAIPVKKHRPEMGRRDHKPPR